jgi:hypothetical protein
MFFANFTRPIALGSLADPEGARGRSRAAWSTFVAVAASDEYTFGKIDQAESLLLWSCRGAAVVDVVMVLSRLAVLRT